MQSRFQIGGHHRCYIIAEIGQNHQGDIELAKRMILSAKECGADCVKFQKSNLCAKFTQQALAQPYTSPNAWAATYGAHKQHLEFSDEQFIELQKYAELVVGIPFTASAMDVESLRWMLHLAQPVPFIKIGSGDANNIPLLEEAAACSEYRRPLVISTGMQTTRQIDRIVRIMREAGHSEWAMMHCISAYPTQPQDVRLRQLQWMRQRFPDVCIGYSGHELGTAVTLAAVVLGARVVERHFTLDSRLKGTDHRVSLMPDELRTLCDRIRAVESLTNRPEDEDPYTRCVATLEAASIELTAEELQSVAASLQPLTEITAPADCELACWTKLGKSLVYAGQKGLRAGHRLEATDVCFKVSVEKGLLEGDYDAIIGRKLRADVAFEQSVRWEHFERE